MSCWSNPKPKTHHTTETLDEVLLDYSERRFQAEISILDSLSKSWGWEPDTLAGGILVQTIFDSSNEKNSLSDEIMLRIRVKLANENLCFVNDSLKLIVGHYEGPKAIDEIASFISEGDSVHALVPSNMGFGVKGLPGFVPPGAMLLVEVSQPIR